MAGPLVWNSLPDYLRDPAVNRDTFCKHRTCDSGDTLWHRQTHIDRLSHTDIIALLIINDKRWRILRAPKS